jgi:hypothetical protein
LRDAGIESDLVVRLRAKRKPDTLSGTAGFAGQGLELQAVLAV